MSLSEDRKRFVTASQAHRVMAGFEIELEGMHVVKPACDDGVFNGIKKMVELLGRKPKVGEMVSVDLVVPGALISEVFNYIKAVTPVFSEGMESVAREIAMNTFKSSCDGGYKSEDMERGDRNEVEAVAALSSLLGVQFLNTGDAQVFLSDECLGVTPDGIQYDGFDITSCVEVKCPKDTTHMLYLSKIKNQDDLLSVRPVYYWQAQCGLEVTQAKTYHWASYHDEFDYPGHDEDLRLVYVPVTPVKEHIELLKIRAGRVLTRAPVIVREILDRDF